MAVQPKLQQQQGKDQKKELSPTRKKVYIGIIIVGNIIAFYLIFRSFSSPSSPSLPPPLIEEPVGSVTNQPNVSGSEGLGGFIDQLKQDLSILSDARFKVLKSLGIEVKAPPAGRENPFVPY
ncbi:hypothetical protein C4553_02130 [Candidatus Parcubacteria bacterium]|nr:MAG: hypothetical protein C4553_02130 [Candidatus Parcubacteria bacterium]